MVQYSASSLDRSFAALSDGTRRDIINQLGQSGSAMAGVAGVYHRHQYTNEKREALALWGREVLLIVAKYPPQDSQEE